MGRLIVPPNKDWIEMGGFVDDEGNRLVALRFEDPRGEPVTVVFEPSFFGAFADQAGRTKQAIRKAAFWVEAVALAEKDRRLR